MLWPAAPILPGLCVVQSNVDANAGRVLLISGEFVGFPDGHNILCADSRSVFFQGAGPGRFRVRRKSLIVAAIPAASIALGGS